MRTNTYRRPPFIQISIWSKIKDFFSDNLSIQNIQNIASCTLFSASTALSSSAVSTAITSSVEAVYARDPSILAKNLSKENILALSFANFKIIILFGILLPAIARKLTTNSFNLPNFGFIEAVKRGIPSGVPMGIISSIYGTGDRVISAIFSNSVSKYIFSALGVYGIYKYFNSLRT